MRPNRLRLALLACSIAACATRPQAGAQPAPRPARPTLVVFITIDQFRGDYLTRFAPQLTGGLARLVAGGAWFRNAVHDHAITETAPGHAATMSGRFPVHTGIAANSVGVGDPSTPLIGSDDAGASPRRFVGTTLLDWMRAADRRTRFLSVSRKDRAAILPIGRSTGDVYWYASNGTFTQSSWYGSSLPQWVRTFNARRLPHRYADYVWTPLLPDSAYNEPDSVSAESRGNDIVFPHIIPDDSTIAAAVLPNYPPMDDLTLAFALAGVDALQLGVNANRTDLLNISLSTTDAVGHRFGPDSRELHDQVLRVDRALGLFLLIALTGDHGVTPFPDVRSTATPNDRARYVSLAAPYASMIRRLAAAGVDTMQVELYDGVFQIGDSASFVRAGLSADSVTRALMGELRAVPGVHRVDALQDLARADTVRDDIARRWLHMFAPDGSVRFVVTLDRFNYWSGARVAMHGSPWDQDAWVPVLFWGGPFRHGVIDDRVRVVDMAPTLADILGIRPLEPLDGVVRLRATSP
jgi:predicted AlkP superfamily pyrophosphatase or phosphodiesterase